MQFLRTLIWVLIAVIVVLFSLNNWMPVSVRLWGGQSADIKLPFLMLVMFLLGFLPAYLLYLGTRWRLKARLAGLERTLADMRATQAAEVVVLPAADPGDPPLILTESPETRS